MIVRRHPEELRDPRPLLVAMEACRRAATDAMHEVKPFCMTFRALSVLTGTIDTVGWFFTGSSSYFHLMQMPDPRDMEPGA